MTKYEKLLAASKQGTSVQIITLVDGPDPTYIDQSILLYPNGSYDGSLLDDKLTAQLIDYITQNNFERPGIFRLKDQDNYLFFRDKYVNSRRAIVFGGGHISQPLVQILALLDFSVTVVDDRPEFANKARFPWAGEVICDQFSSVLKNIKYDIDEGTAVIIVTRGHRYDLDCLRSTIRCNSGYLGMIGSRRRISGITEIMREEGASDEDIKKLHAPIGIDIGAATPAEIALSIAAQVVATFNAGSLAPLSLQKRC